MSDVLAQEFEQYRTRLLALGYRMLGSRAEAEDLVQETWLRWHRTPREEIREPAAWLRTAMTRLSIDSLRARRTRAEEYVGPWLPEPCVTAASEAADTERAVALAEDLSVAFLLLLERLGAEERAAFLLHEVFDAGYAEIAAALGKSEAAVRKLVSRSRRRVAEERPRFRVARGEQQALAERFAAAVAARDEASLIALLAADARLVADGGGKALAALRPILGAAKIARFFLGITRDEDIAGWQLEPCWLNDAPGFIVREADGTIRASTAFEIRDGRIAAVYTMRNPDKLARLDSSWPGTGHGTQ